MIDASSFIIPSTQRSRPEPEGWENQLWTDRNGPKDLGQLCIPPRKVNDIMEAINHSSIYKSAGKLKVLILTGKTGTGKSTLVKLLAEKNNIQVIEWEAEERISNDPDYVPTINRFESFINNTVFKPTLVQNNRKKIILLDDLPDLTTNEIRSKFQDIMTGYILDRHPFLMVIIISDAVSDSVDSSHGSVETKMTQVHDIMPEALTNTPYVRSIVVNPVTTATMRKKLKEIVAKEKSSATERDINDIIEMAEGDLKTAINHLQFYFPPGRKGTQKPLSKDFKNESSTLSLFHALGKVLYAKRIDDGTLESKPVDIVENLPCTADHFISHIEANLLNYRNLNDIEAGLKFLADADTLRPRDYGEDFTLRETRALVSIGGSMSSRKNPLPHNPPPFRPLTRNLPSHVSRSQNLENIALTVNRVPSEERNNDSWDNVSDYNSDEEQDFDDIFGDGSDLADMVF